MRKVSPFLRQERQGSLGPASAVKWARCFSALAVRLPGSLTIGPGLARTWASGGSRLIRQRDKCSQPDRGTLSPMNLLGSVLDVMH